MDRVQPEKSALSMTDIVELTDMVEDLKGETEIIYICVDDRQGLMVDDAPPCFWRYTVDQIPDLLAVMDNFVASGVLVKVVRDDCRGWKLPPGKRDTDYQGWLSRPD